MNKQIYRKNLIYFVSRHWTRAKKALDENSKLRTKRSRVVRTLSNETLNQLKMYIMSSLVEEATAAATTTDQKEKEEQT